MANQYERYLSRLRNLKASRPEMQVYERNMAQMAEPYNILNRRMAQMTQAGGASTASQVAALNEGRGQWNQMQQQNYGQAVDAVSKREGQIDAKIAEVEFQNEQYKEEQRRRKAARRSGLLRTVVSGIGMAAGAVLAPLTGGASMLAGAALGGAIGQTASGFMGINKDGNLSLNPDEWDMGAIEQGLASTASILATSANQNATKNKVGILSSNADKISRYILENPDMAPSIQFQIESIMDGGTAEDLRILLERLSNGIGGQGAN